MNQLPEKQETPRPKTNRPFRGPHTARPLHKTSAPSAAIGSRFPQKKAPSRDNRTSRGSFQYGANKGGRRPHVKAPTPTETPIVNKKRTQLIPPPEAGVIRIIPLGGVEEIGKNMTAIEIGNDIIVIDAGMQFKTEDTPGIDYIIPNTTYLEERKDKIRAMIVTHGHLDHIGGIPLVMSRIGNPPLYSRNLSILLMKKRQEEFPHLPALNMNIVEKDSVIYAGDIRVRFFGVTHTVPDSMGIIIETPYGSIVTPGDYKLDQVDGIVSDEEEK